MDLCIITKAGIYCLDVSFAEGRVLYMCAERNPLKNICICKLISLKGFFFFFFPLLYKAIYVILSKSKQYHNILTVNKFSVNTPGNSKSSTG